MTAMTKRRMPVPASRSRGSRRTVSGLVSLMLAAVSVAALQTSVRADQGDGSNTAVQGRITGGGLSSCAALSTGAVQCWGSNDHGQLGNGTVVASTPPATASGIANAKAVSAGNAHSCALLTDGTARCWGLAASGQVGDGSTGDPLTQQSRRSPVPVTGLSGATTIAAGGFHTCAIVGTGTVKCWGDDGTGQLGDGTNFGSKSPVPISASGITTATVIAAGEFHTCAILSNNTVRCWGHNGFGQLGDGTKADRKTPVAVVGLPDPAAAPGNVPVALTAGYGHTCVLLKDTTARCWGGNASGELGHETSDTDGDGVMDPSTSPLTVQHDADPDPLFIDLQNLTGMAAIAAGDFHNCALMSGGGGRCWGQNGRGQLGTDPNPMTEKLDDSSSAVKVSGLSGASAVTAGGFHNCAIVGTDAKCWGYNFYGQLGSFAASSHTPVQVTAVQGATETTAGTGFACALVDSVTSNTPVCWGDNSSGRLGAGLSVPNSTRRTAVAGIGTAAGLDAGNGHACALLTSPADVRCWGLNTSGEMGDGSNVSSGSPRPVSGLSDASTISAGGALDTIERGHTCSTRSNSKVACWGHNAEGQLGNDPDATTPGLQDSNVPVVVQVDANPDPLVTTLVDLAGAQDAVAGGSHSCAVVGGKGLCWGANAKGQLGDGTTTAHMDARPVQKDTDPDVDDPLTGIEDLVAGRRHTCALLNDGSVVCWGDNSRRQLGDGTNADRPIPVPVSGIDASNPADAIIAGDNHTCARLVDGAMQCWGANNVGQLGNGSTADASTPQQVSDPNPNVKFGPSPIGTPFVRAMSGSRNNTCALLIDTSVYCWGDNTHGQLGDGIGPLSVAPLGVANLGPI